MAFNREIIECLNNKNHFILTAGAGSGKTYTLIETLKYILKSTLLLKNKKIACVTYTNIAKEEIINRLNYNSKVEVYTIHNFIWENIKLYQANLKKLVLNKLENKGKLTPEIKTYLINEIKKIEYKNYEKLEEGVISHNCIIEFGVQLLNEYPNLIRCLSEKYNYLFIDEYQDTNEQILKVIDEKIKPSDFVVGCFGDPCQKIYSGKLYKLSENFRKINKIENFRCSKEVIKILNLLREDIKQIPQENNLEGKVKFYYNPNNNNKIDSIINDDFPESEFKVLYLTHKSIAKEEKYSTIFKIISSKDVNEKDNINSREQMKSNLLNYLYYDLCDYITLYEKKYIPELLKKIKKPLTNIKDRNILRKELEELSKIAKTKPVEDILNYVSNTTYISNINLEQKDIELLEKIKNINFIEILTMYKVIFLRETNSITNHGTKGAEYNNVYIKLNCKDWNRYNYDKFFSNTANETSKENIRNILYVSFSRAKENLVINMSSKLSETSLENLKKLFGEQNVIEV